MKPTIQKLRRRLGRTLFPVRKIDFGQLARTEPFCRNYGFSRGKAIDRVFVEQFLEHHRSLIRGRCLEVLNNRYTTRFGAGQVTRSDIIDINPENTKATICDDLRTLSSIESDTFDSVILTQTLHLLDDDAGCLRQLHRVLRPGGSLLLTVPCISKVGRSPEDGTWNRFYTDHGLAYLLEQAFQPSDFVIESFGNVRLAAAFLYGLAVAEVEPKLFHLHDPEYPMIVGARAIKHPLPTSA